MNVQKIDAQAGFTQLSGSGSPENSTVGYVGQTYRNTDNDDLYEKATGDGTNTGWVQKTGSGATIPDATELQAGKVEIANQAEAETGTDNGNKAMNPLKTKQAFAAFIAAHEAQKIINTRVENNEVLYGSDIDIETSTEIKSRGLITYLNGVYTVGKDCTLLGSCTLTFRNNGAPENDNSYLHIYKSTDNGSTFTSITNIPIEPSTIVNSSQFIGQSFTDLAFDLNDGDQFKFGIGNVNLAQYLSNTLVTFKEQ